MALLSKFMYKNTNNPDFRRRLLQMAWDEGHYEEVSKMRDCVRMLFVYAQEKMMWSRYIWNTCGICHPFTILTVCQEKFGN